ncbi:hypothetical protein PAHAL_9G436200 [Panicum hallii]|uniref:Uncharacterized protein n=1 Tax=Panicum hallii TaxID=206008 RepID=A0A2T8I4K2_9POAL|nr:hypothetical protein PAHAL_9G436200 [Panicum hallii]
MWPGSRPPITPPTTAGAPGPPAPNQQVLVAQQLALQVQQQALQAPIQPYRTRTTALQHLSSTTAPTWHLTTSRPPSFNTP